MAHFHNVNALRTFTLAAQSLSFTQAARELNVSTSAVSHQVRALEEYLGLRLFLREPKQLVLTPEGEYLFQQLSLPFQSIDAAVAHVQRRTTSRQVSLICRPFFSSFWLAARLHDFWARHPRISLNLIHQTTLGLADFDRADLAVVWGKAPPPGMTAYPLLSGGLTPILHASLAREQGIPKQPADLRDYVLLHEESRLGWGEWLAKAGVPDVVGCHSYLIDDTNVRYQSMLRGQGIMLGMANLLRPQIEGGELVQPFTLTLEEYGYWLVHPEARRPTLRAQQVIDWLGEQVGGFKAWHPAH